MAWTRAQETFMNAALRNPQRGGKHELDVATKVLEPDEVVYEYLLCALKGDSWPLLVVTDRRIVHTVDRMVAWWHVREEVPAAQVAGAELEPKLLSWRLHVHRHGGDPLTVKVADRKWSEHVVALVNHLAAGGAPPL
ncbi:hypothetical protein [Georgenia sp. Z1491]|uniref:hypothetical protein n=1 Tax=Georgenia sp. Z1491 TaxID=3416707 RepID=UPI003CF84D5E